MTTRAPFLRLVVMLPAIVLGVVVTDLGIAKTAVKRAATHDPFGRAKVSVALQGASVPPAASVPPTAASSITDTLLPDAAINILRTEHVAPQPFPKLVSAKNHHDDDRDCGRCHRIGGEAKLPPDHTGSKEHPAWSLKSCNRCHLWESTPASSRADVPLAEMAGNSYCVACHGNRSLKMDFPQGERHVSMFVNRESYGLSVHGKLKLPCVGCHRIMKYPHEKAAFPTLREVVRSIEKQSCLECHDKQAAEFRTSVHGRAFFEKNNLDVPGCTDCHGFHEASWTRTVQFRMGTVDTCSGCHSDTKLAAKYKMSPNVTRSYLRDFHGMTIRLTRDQGPNIASFKPVCYDCHGIHDIQRTDDPRSTVMKNKLVVVCQKCHKGAGSNFPTAWMSHYEPSLKKWPIVYWVQVAYKILIPLVLAPFGIYMLLELARWWIDRVRRRRGV